MVIATLEGGEIARGGDFGEYERKVMSALNVKKEEARFTLKSQRGAKMSGVLELTI